MQRAVKRLPRLGKAVSPLETAKLYFELSNKSDLEAIRALLTTTTTYSSPNTGVFFGVDDIIEMQKQFHAKLKSLHWEVTSVKELSSNICLFEYDFTATDSAGEELSSSGSEYVIAKDGKIHHIEIRNKS